MNKELEALTMLKNITIINFEDENGVKRIVFADEVYKEQFELIEAKFKDYDMLLEEYNLMKKEYDLLKRSLNRNWVEVVNDEKKIKVLEIIKRIGLHEAEYMMCVEYEIYYLSRDNPIPKEEYDLLKEVLL